MTHLKQLLSETHRLADPQRAKTSLWFFKTGKGEYGEGDQFIGLNNPTCRLLAKKYQQLSLSEINQLLALPIHEHRLIGLLILVHQFHKNPNQRDQIFDFYLKHTDRINNWDLVDLSAHKIIGAYLLNRNRKILYSLARSNSLWERRIAIISTFAFIKNGEIADSLKLAYLLLGDQEDLIHKAVGWVLRDVGKLNQSELEKFLTTNVSNLPRTTLRYAIEKFPEPKRQHFLKL